MNGRNARSCRERWRSFLSPNLVNGPWSHEEDQLLEKLVKEYGQKWKRISQEFKGRSECNLKNRWMRHLRQMVQEPTETTEPTNKEPAPNVTDAESFPDFPDAETNIFDDFITNDFEFW
ncbi:Myb-like DNA-binding domain containing protein [Histomonas meleagridis]|uniref:Myb-like DNA-binding domain containing protein n=1 Tax=Histomonas meleagridis TaxID=135588 RepID=UPI0035597406|nr:Myb-like DNA-binding domain containing protein [Histomonas meleagridis]KAH0796184.1 Myb-like DNA-binding domain containing protein [Histomonas meleagridis]